MMGSRLFQGHKRELSRLGFKLWSPIPFSKKITGTLSETPTSINVSLYFLIILTDHEADFIDEKNISI